MIKTQEIEGVVKIKLARSLLGRPFYFTTAYWVDGLLIDTGCAHTQEELLAAVEDLGIDRIVNTHSHEDHFGANGALQARWNVEVLAHAESLPTLADPRLLRLQPYRHIFWGYPTPSVAQPVGEVVETTHHRFQVIHTPGHSPDHICLYELEKGWLFTGDAYIGGRDRGTGAGTPSKGSEPGPNQKSGFRPRNAHRLHHPGSFLGSEPGALVSGEFFRLIEHRHPLEVSGS